MKSAVILRGISGAGKSTLAQKLMEKELSIRPKGPAAILTSADNFFMSEGKYNFDPTKLGPAHSFCFRNFLESLRQSTNLIIVDNTNTTAIEIAPYYQAAKAYDFDVKIVTLVVDPLVAVSRNVHGTSIETIMKQKIRLEAEAEKFPPWWKHELANGEPYPR